MEAHVISFFQKIQVSALCWKAFVDGVLGLLRAYPWTLYGERCHSNKCQLLNMLRNELRPAIRSKRRERLTQGVLLLHDNARPHTAHPTINTIRQLNWEVLEHTAYSPDLAPSDFRLFGPLKNALRDRRFAADDEVEEAVHNWLRSQPQTFFSNGIKKLTDRWAKCIEKGDYIEN